MQTGENCSQSFKEDGRRMSYNVVLHGSRATCPECGGTMVQRDGESWKCIDCRRLFMAAGEGQTEGEIICERIR